MDLRIVRVHLDGNALQTLNSRAFFERLPSLTTLSASRNELTELPDLLLRELLSLGLSHNAITAVALPAPRFGRALCDRFPQLQALDLSHNRLVELPAALAGLRGLRELRLEHNQLASLLPCLASPSEAATRVAQSTWPMLNALDVSGNAALDALPSALGHCTRLTRLGAEACPLAWPPPDVMATPLAQLLAFLRAHEETALSAPATLATTSGALRPATTAPMPSAPAPAPTPAPATATATTITAAIGPGPAPASPTSVPPPPAPAQPPSPPPPAPAAALESAAGLAPATAPALASTPRAAGVVARVSRPATAPPRPPAVKRSGPIAVPPTAASPPRPTATGLALRKARLPSSQAYSMVRLSQAPPQQLLMPKTQTQTQTPPTPPTPTSMPTPTRRPRLARPATAPAYAPMRAPNETCGFAKPRQQFGLAPPLRDGRRKKALPPLLFSSPQAAPHLELKTPVL